MYENTNAMRLSTQIFSNRNFVRYWLAGWLSSIGDSVFIVTLTWMLAKQTGSPLVVGTYLSIVGATKVVFVLLGGLIVDRLDVRKLLIISDWLRALVMVVFAAIAFRELPPIWSFYLVGFIFGIVDSVVEPASIFTATQIVPREYYTQAMSFFLVTGNASAIIGPMLGAALVWWGGAVTAIALNGLSFAVSAVLLTTVTFDLPEQMHDVTMRTLFTHLGEGFRYFLHNRVLALMATNAFFANAAIGLATLAVPFLVLDLGMGVGGYGLIQSSLGVGGAIGAVLLSLFVIERPTPRMALTTSLLQGALILLIAWTGQFWLVVLSFALIGLNEAAVNVIAPSVNTLVIPCALFGRVISVTMIIMDGSAPLFQAAGGWLMQTISVRQVFFFGGILEILAASIIFFAPAIRQYDASSVNVAHS